MVKIETNLVVGDGNAVVDDVSDRLQHRIALAFLGAHCKLDLRLVLRDLLLLLQKLRCVLLGLVLLSNRLVERVDLLVLLVNVESYCFERVQN